MRRAFADFRVDRALHCAPDAEPEPSPGASIDQAVAGAQHRKTHTARDRYSLGHRQGLQLRQYRRSPRTFAPDGARTHQKHLSQARGQHPRRSGVRGASAGPDPAMTEIAAQRLSAPRGSRSSARVSRLGIHLAIQLLVAAACVLLLRQPLPQPSPRYRLTDARLIEEGSEREIALPDRSKPPSPDA